MMFSRSANSGEWPTPRDFFDKLNRRYRFTLDAAANAENAKCELFYTKEQDGLAQDWGTHRVFCNPPYGNIRPWVRKAFEASQQGALVVMVLPAHTGPKWFHDWVKCKAKVEFIRGRLTFGNADNCAPFSSMLVVYSPDRPAKTCARCGNAFIGRSDAVVCSNKCRQALYRQKA